MHTSTKFNVLQVLNRTLPVIPAIEHVRYLLSNFDLAFSSLRSLISYVDLQADNSNYENYSIKKYSLDLYMRLDSAAVCALNLFESKTDLNKNFSLFGLFEAGLDSEYQYSLK